ncbi:MAG TPA: hypothetical protein VFM80_02165 [Gracilimonas sp.]|uniref:hypothetical protein n=1 Tax=Gracilimonas sp. TaxID=1974203 RepID=UPI002D818B2F|nr:hypothetical protein [Gracilimonas sp.]
MFEEEEHKDPIVSDDLSQSKGNKNSFGISVFMERIHSINGLHFLSAISQIFLGTSVVALSLLNSIEPLWLATIMTVFGSITTMLGLYLMYRTIVHAGTFDTLLHKAIKRVVSSQN